MKRVITFIFLMGATVSYSMPQNIEVWFLGLQQEASLLKSKKQYAYTQCQSVGEYCFDPQIGLYKKEKSGLIKAIDNSEVENSAKYDFLDSASSLDRDIVECEKGNLFDLFCGKAKPTKFKKISFEVWVDTSSTMKQIDNISENRYCQRRFFAESLNESCGTKKGMRFYSLKEYKKEVSYFADLCKNSGLNNTKNLIRDIKASKAKNLLIITDVFEAFSEFTDFLESQGAIIKGLDKPMYAGDMKKQLKKLIKKCK